MSLKSVLICDRVDPILKTILQNHKLDVKYNPEITEQQLQNEIHNFDIIIVRSRTKLTSSLINKAQKCKLIARVGVGLDNIDLSTAKTNHIKIITSAEATTTSVAELVLGMMFSLSRQIINASIGIQNHKWLKNELTGIELKGKYLGIIGFGNIGKRLDRLARAINMNIIVHDVFPIDNMYSKELGIMKTDLDTLLQSSDYVSLHIPLNDSTYHLIDEKKLTLMKKTSILINTSRGGIVDEKDLYHALQHKQLAGAALDVFEHEPAINTKLSTLTNVVLTPHIGAQTKEAQSLSANVIAEKIIQLIQEDKL